MSPRPPWLFFSSGFTWALAWRSLSSCVTDMYVLSLYSSALIGKTKHLSMSGGSTPTVCLEQMPVSHMSAVKIQKEKTPTHILQHGSAVSQVVACVLLGEACTSGALHKRSKSRNRWASAHRDKVRGFGFTVYRTDPKIPDNYINAEEFWRNKGHKHA